MVYLPARNRQRQERRTVNIDKREYGVCLTSLKKHKKKKRRRDEEEERRVSK